MKKNVDHMASTCQSGRNGQSKANSFPLKNMVIKMFAMFYLVQFPLLVSGQDEEIGKSTPEERAQYQTEWMTSNLALEASVVPVVHEINLKHATQNQSILNSGGTKAQKYKALKASSTAKDAELKKVLTSDQYQLYQQKKEELKQKMRERIQEKRSSK